MPHYPFSLNPWLARRQQRLLDNAYRAAQEIRALEEKYFNGGKIEESSLQNKTVTDYVKDRCDRQLFKVRTNLVQFRLNTFVLNQRPRNPGDKTETPSIDLPDTNLTPLEDPAAGEPGRESANGELDVLEKLSFIDSVVRKYREDDLELQSLMKAEDDTQQLPPALVDEPERSEQASRPSGEIVPQDIDALKMRRSRFLGGLRRRDAPEIEAQRIQEHLRLKRKQRQTAVRWLVILVAVPFIVALIAKNFVFEPILGTYQDRNPTKIELSEEIKEEFSLQLTLFKEQLEVRELLGIDELTPEEKQEQLSEKAAELWREANDKELNGIKNVLADSVALLAFLGLVFFNRSKLSVIRNFSNQTFLNLADPTKVFLFILITDMFVGFHSPEGWDTILKGIENHFGLPENEAAINMFIATVPVLMDTCIKFWIFNYLTRFSPSTSAVYERMNN